MNTSHNLFSLSELRQTYIRSDISWQRGKQLNDMAMCTLLTRDDDRFRVLVEDRFADFTVDIKAQKDRLSHSCDCRSHQECCHHTAAALLHISNMQEEENPASAGSSGQTYTREEMIARVMGEREERAAKEKYRITFEDNVYGPHQLKTEVGRLYEITFRDFSSKQGYCSCPDYQTNKLGTCKHLIAGFREAAEQLPLKKMIDRQPYPFIEIYCDPHNSYRITCFYKGQPSAEYQALLDSVFGSEDHVLPERYDAFPDFLKKARQIKKILVRPEVYAAVDAHFEQQMLRRLAGSTTPDYSVISAQLYPYQQEGIEFCLYKSGAIIADEMGLGKTLQAISVAMLKKTIYGIRRVLVICPASLKFQWCSEIAKFSGEQALVVEGAREARQEMYRSSDAFFLIANYEAVMRDVTTIQQYAPDMIILDEAQRIKNYATKTSYAVKAIPKKHALVITGTPIENRLGDLYSIMNFIGPGILAPLWEFSMNHCYFDKSKKDRITGYYNLQALKERIAPWVIRREKKDVLEQLPDLQEVTIPITLHPKQEEIHTGLAQSLMPIVNKKFKTIYDMQRIHQILTSMRMVCDSTFLYDKETNISPKLEELQEILLEKLDIRSEGKKVIIFSEWKTMLQLIARMLQGLRIGSVTLSGEVPVKKRGALIEEFRNNPDCKVFLSTEAGGSGLNLQFADTVINFELPWNPAKKNQRIGRVHRIGQKSNKILAINLVAQSSIESRILDGIVLKESLFDAVLQEGNLIDEVDFTKKGRVDFLQQVAKLLEPFEDASGQIDERETLQEQEAGPVENDADAGVSEEAMAAAVSVQPESTSHAPAQPAPSAQDLQESLNHGLQFLSGMMKMITGKELIAGEQSIVVDRESGEVTMKFRLPGGVRG